MAEEHSDPGEDTHWDLKYRSEEEMEFFTEMALHETQRWIEAVTRQTFTHPDDPRKSLENGVLLCELLNCLKAGSVKKINRFQTPLAGLDNINVFLEACHTVFGLTKTQLFDSGELQDLSQRAIADKTTHLKEENDRRLRNVAVTIFFLGKSAIATDFNGPSIDSNAFAGLFEHQHVDLIPEKTSAYSTSWENKRQRPSNKYFSNSELLSISGNNDKGSRLIDDEQHIADSSYESIGSKGSDDNQSIGSDGMPVSASTGIHHFGGSVNSLQESQSQSKRSSLDSDIYQSNSNLYDINRKSPISADSASDAMSCSSGEGSRPKLVSRAPIVAPTVDPLQFIKAKTNPLTEVAKKQQSLSEKNKAQRASIALEQEEDWHSDLTSWKSRRQSRKSISVAVQEPEDKQQVAKRPVKTFKEMVAGRDKRKSLMMRYTEDEDDWSGWSNSSNSKDVSKQSDSTQASPGDITAKSENSGINDSHEGSNNTSINNNNNNNNGLSSNNNNTNNNNNSSNRSSIVDNSDDDVFLMNKVKLSESPEVKGVGSGKGVVVMDNVQANNLKNMEHSAKLEDNNSTVTPAVPPPEVPHKDSYQETLSNNSQNQEHFSKNGSREKPVPAERISSQRADKDFVERTIRISQSLKCEKGFGFLIRGGVDQNSPVIVHRIELGSAADICELRPRDVIVSINSEDIQQQTQQKVQHIIDRAIQHGKIELRVRRYLRGGATYNDDDPSAVNDSVTKHGTTPDAMPQSVPVTNSDIITETTRPMNYSKPESKLTKLDKSENSLGNGQDNHNGIESSPLKVSLELKQADTSSIPTLDSQIEDSYNNNNSNESVEMMKPPIVNLEITDRPATEFPKETFQPHQRSISSDSAASSLSSLSPASSTTSIQPPAILRRWQNSKTKSQRPLSSEFLASPKSEDNSFESKMNLNSTFPPRNSISVEKSAVLESEPSKKSEQLFQVRDIRSYTRENDNTCRVGTFLPTLDNKVRVPTITAKEQPFQKDEEVTKNFSAPLNIQIPNQTLISTPVLQIDPKNQISQTTIYNKGENDLPEYNFNVQLTPAQTLANQGLENEGKLWETSGRQHMTSLAREEEEEEEEEGVTERKRVEEHDPAVLDAHIRMLAQERQLIEEEKGKRLQEQRMKEEAEEKRRLQQKELMLQQEKEELEREKQRIEREKRKMYETQQALLEQQERLEREKKSLLEQQRSTPPPQPSFAAQPPPPSSLSPPLPPPPSFPSSSTTSSSSPSHPNSRYVVPTQTRPSPDVSSRAGLYTVVNPNKTESSGPRFSNAEPEPKEVQRLTREDLLAMNRKATPLQEKPEVSSSVSHSNSPIKREPPTKVELHSLNAVPRARHRDPKEWIAAAAENSNVGKKQPPVWSANRKSEFYSASSYSPSLSSSSVSKEYSPASSRHGGATVPVNNLSNYRGTQSQVGSQSHKLSDHWTEGKEGSSRGSSENRLGRPLGENVNYASQDLAPLKVGLKPYIFKKSSIFTPINSALSQSSENILKAAAAATTSNPRHSYSSYGDSAKSGDLNSTSYHNYSGSNPSMHTSKPYHGDSRTAEPHQREGSAGSRLASSKSSPNVLSDRMEQVPVTGVEKCSHCHEMLMNSAAMAIETLGLYYHVKCFRCSVCHIQLGNGSRGTDVRIRHQKLHCHNCYSYNEAGLKFSEV
ncbi:LIM and calponin homology domains-containing protein 1-like isoform X3 [Argonauta hians]